MLAACPSSSPPIFVPSVSTESDPFWTQRDPHSLVMFAQTCLTQTMKDGSGGHQGRPCTQTHMDAQPQGRRQGPIQPWCPQSMPGPRVPSFQGGLTLRKGGQDAGTEMPLSELPVNRETHSQATTWLIPDLFGEFIIISKKIIPYFKCS